MTRFPSVHMDRCESVEWMRRQGKPSVYVARCDAEPEPSAWSNAGKARSYVEDRYSDAVDWQSTGDDRWIGRVDGDVVGRVEAIEIMDPSALAARWPEELPGTEYIGDAPPDA